MGKVIGITQSYSGDLVQFSTVKGGDITSLNVPISPEQDLHGYASPWGPGAGKSKVPVSMTSNDYTAYGINVTVNDDGTITTSGSNTGAGNLSTISNPIFSASDIADKLVDGQTYFFTACPAGGSSSTYRATIRKTTNGSSSYITDTGSGASFTYDAASTYIAYININQTVDVDGFEWKPMICLDSESDKVWEPYANVCPITGRTRANAYRTGKNLCKVARGWGSAQGIVYTENADGTVHCKGTATGDSFSGGSIIGSAKNIDSRCMYTVPAGTYTISNIAGVRIRVQFRNADNTAQIETSTNVSVGSSKTFTFAEPTIIYIRSYIATGTDVDTDMYVMVTEGSTAATEYEPWQMKTVTVNWYTQAGTVYAGKFDFISGELTATMANIASYNGETIGEPWLSSLDEYTPGGTPTTGAQVVYTLTDPIAYQLSGREIAALVGVNNVLANNGATVSLSVLVPLTGFKGWLIKCVTNGTGVEIPLKYIRAETYSVTPDQRMEWSAERDVTGVLHRETVQNLPPKIEFNTPLMDNTGINALNTIIRNAFTNELQRNITIQFYDPERDEYWEWDCYMPDVKYQIRNVDAANHIINYEETRYAFIGY